MAKKAAVRPTKSKAIVRRPANAASVLQLEPAAIAEVTAEDSGVRMELPADWQGPDVNVLPSGLTPTVVFEKPGDMVAGVLVDVKSDVGPNKSMLYNLRATDKETGEVSDIAVWGGAVLDSKMRLNMPPLGSEVLIIYMRDLPAKSGQNPGRDYDVRWRKVATAPAK